VKRTAPVGGRGDEGWAGGGNGRGANGRIANGWAAGAARLTILALRRDCALVLTWTALFAGLLAGAAHSFRDVYPDAAALEAYSQAIAASPVQHFFNGPGAGLATRGGMLVFEMGGYLLTVVAVLSILTVVRHGRRVEADATGELLRAGAVGRGALLVSASCAAFVEAAWWGLACAATLGLTGMGWEGAAAYGASMAAAGAAYATVAALASQLGEQPRTATALAGAVLAADFAVRGVRDTHGGGPAWFSPLSWVFGLRPFAAERWWPLLAVAAFVLAGHCLAAVVVGRRDLGQGLWPARPGPVHASRGLARPAGLVWSLRRPVALGWWAVIGGFAFADGLIAREFSQTGDSLNLYAFVGDASGPVAALVEFAALLLAVLAAAAGVALAGGASREEASGRLDATLAGGIGRVRWAAAEAGCALAGAWIALVIAVGALAGGIALAGQWDAAGDPVGAVTAYLPAVSAVVALAVALFGVAPRWTALAWTPLAYGTVTGLFGAALQLPEWADNLSPFAYAPRPPAELVWAPSQWVLTTVAFCLAAAGAAAFRARVVNS
jgi:ABC-2 type transport system permease protein